MNLTAMSALQINVHTIDTQQTLTAAPELGHGLNRPSIHLQREQLVESLG